MKKQKTTKKVILKKKAAKKTVSKPEKKELIRALSGKPSRTKKKTPAKKAPAKKAVAKKAAVKKTIKKPAPQKAVKPAKKEIKKPLEELTVAELKTLAKELGIALKSGPKKADIIKAIGKSKAEVAKKEKVVSSPLPVDYGENKLVSMPVTPGQVYAYWEITEDTISEYEGSLNLKVINTKTNAFFYMPISERIGEQFISVGPAAEYAVEIGVINYKGEFVRIMYSSPVETPVSGIAPVEISGAATVEAGILPEEFFETPESISSY